MYLQLRSMGHLKTIPAETLASDPHCRKVLSNAMSAASCTDLAGTFNHSNETGDGAADNVTAAAVALVTKVRNTRATLVDQIMAATAVADQLEEENGIRQLIAGLDADVVIRPSAVCMTCKLTRQSVQVVHMFGHGHAWCTSRGR